MDECPTGYGSAKAWCEWRNSIMDRNDVEWIVGSRGTPVLVDRKEWSASHHFHISQRNEIERRKFNWRLEHPVDEKKP